MADQIIPAAVKLAAKRAFVRTTMQGYEGVLVAGLSANAVLAWVRGEVDPVTLGVTAAVTVLAPPLAGLRSWLSITRKGIPEDYSDATLAAHAELDEEAQRAGIEDAQSRIALRRDYR